MLSGFLYS